jgi:rhodanese-related sulfurtransferase
MTATGTTFDLAAFQAQPNQFTLVDIRSRDEHANSPIFAGTVNIPLPELRERAHEIPLHKPVLIHCAGGYRSAAGVSIVAGQVKQVPVFDFSEAIKDFQTGAH